MSEESGIAATSTSTSALTDLTLSVRIDGVPEQEVFLQHGLSIGRNASNAICVNEAKIERIHAMVCRQADGTMLLECTSEHLRLTLPDGSAVHSLPLNPGTTFKLGKAVIRCLKRQTRATVVVSDNPWQVRCPRCQETIVHLPRDAGKCPACNLEIQYFQSHAGGAGAATGTGAVTGGGAVAAGAQAPQFEGWLPREVGPYRIRAFVAQGGMGIILRGLHKESDRPAAVKLLKFSSDEDPSWKARFLAEIDTLKTLRHPNVVHLQEHGKDDKMLWLAMDWIDGEPLSKISAKFRAEGKNVPMEEIQSTLIQVVAGLEYLHGRQIIHRDLKPSNVLMSHDALVKMVDFGIARAASGQTSVMTQLTHTGMVAGTESYMSPEQSEGQNVTAASDIYSLGVLWYELVTGRRPVGAFMAPHLVRPECPMQWSNLIAQCLQVMPQARPSLAAIAAGLESRGMAPPPLPGAMPAQGPVARPPAMPQTWGAPATPHPHPAQTGVYPATTVPPMTPRPPVQAMNVPPAGAVAPPPVVTGGMAPAGGQVQPARPQPGGGGGAGGTGAAVMSAVRGATGTVGSFFRKHPPGRLLQKLGPAGRWMAAHRGPSIAAGALVLVVILVLIIRGCSSGPSTETGGGGGGGGAAAGGGNVPAPARNEPTVETQYREAFDQMNTARDQASFQKGFEQMQKAAERGYLPAMKTMWSIRLDQRYQGFYNYNDGVNWLRKAAAAGDADSIRFLKQMEIR